MHFTCPIKVVLLFKLDLILVHIRLAAENALSHSMLDDVVVL